MTPPFILASGSPRRRQLLEAAGYRFRVVPTDAEEPDERAFASAADYAVCAAVIKAAACPEADGWILAADTVADGNGVILGKADDRAHAFKILDRLQGSAHDVITGVCLRLPEADLSLTCAVATKVRMRPMNAAQIEEYLDTGLWEGKAGAYGIQDHDDPFVEATHGSYSNVMGLPMERLNYLFEQANRLSRH